MNKWQTGDGTWSRSAAGCPGFPHAGQVNSDWLLALVVVTALAFDFTNGFHDTGNAMATSIATGALPPRIAVALSGALNLVGAFLSFSVAATIATDPNTECLKSMMVIALDEHSHVVAPASQASPTVDCSITR